MDTTEKTLLAVQVRHCALELARPGTGALARLYNLTAHRLVRYALMLTRNQDDAEDAVQAAMVRIAQRPRALADAWHPWPYFLKVVRNEALKILRHAKPSALPESALESPADGTSWLENSESRECVQSALRLLPPEQAEVVVLKIWEDMTFIEISEVLGQSPNTIASRYRYALQKLTPQLRSLFDGGRDV